MGDFVPDFKQFIKEVADQNLIDKGDMTLSTTAVVEKYSGGTLMRVPGFKNNEILPQHDRQAGYQIIGDWLKENRPEAITLRVKDDGKHGHTISLQRNSDGKTYTVIDPASKANGTQFDPENVRESFIGDPTDLDNPYKDKAPYRFDYIKKGNK
jgi:hypothetical protein